ncbi:MAG: hypothetical protein HYR74_01420 [Candidatus Eisenbacteria bacterium]|nr:hypothetical protein [Candidatus Eisenbacteria bacterium]
MRQRPTRRLRLATIVTLVAGGAVAGVAGFARSSAAPAAVTTAAKPAAASADATQPVDLTLEREDDPPGIPVPAITSTQAAATVVFGRFTSAQVNVNAQQANIVGDGANEPSIAVDPTNPNRMVIGWRQFDTISSNFRQAGYGYTTDGGVTWTAGKINPGVFRSDPVLDFDAEGRVYYNSLMGNFTAQVYPSSDGGATWGANVAAFGGDKQWMTIDRTASAGHDQFYEAWSTASNPTPPNTFSRSINDGVSWQSPIAIPNSPIWGTLDVASDGTLYIVGTAGPGSTIYVTHSLDARNSGSTPTFTTVPVSLGGTIRFQPAMNPAGLAGQLWIGVDRSGGPHDGWVYVLASVQTPTDPLDVMFIRSTDGGNTWSTPRRVNDDPTGTRAYQWFGTMSVAPNGRIDAVWNDTRGSADTTMSALYYSYSDDGGTTWSVNEQASPTWNATIGWPNQQNKIGDYCTMISRTDGADLAWAATFNGEEDVYYTRITLPNAGVAERLPPRFRLRGNLPNPFATSTAIDFEAPTGGGAMHLAVYDAAGRRVATLVDGVVDGGPHTVRWNGLDNGGHAVGSGLYLCRLEAAGAAETRKLMRLR